MRRALLIPAVALVSCAVYGPTPVGEHGQAIIGGTMDNGDPAVVMVLAASNQGQAICTGEVVSPHVVLTAAHCVDPAIAGQGNTYQIFLGSDYNDQQQANDQSNWVAVKETHYDTNFNPNQLDSGHDVAVVITDTAIPVTPLAMNRTPLSQNDVGDSVRLVGYGIDNGNDQQGNSAGTKRQTKTTLSNYDQLLIDFTDGAHETCEGDSGGPAFIGQNGVEVIAGITSFGDVGCQMGGYDTRVDDYAATFVDPYITKFDGQPNPPPNPPADMAQQPPPPDMAMAPGPSPSPDLAQAPHLVMDMAHHGVDLAHSGNQPGSPVGASCTSHAQCASGACAESRGTGYCTQACDPNNANSCPVGFQCGLIGSDPYCVLPTFGGGSSGGCSVGGRANGSLPSLLALLVLPALLLRRRRRDGRQAPVAK